MANKAEKTTKKVDNDAERTNDKTYRAYLEVGKERIATITLRAEDDDDARQQLERSKPPYFEGIGKWTLTKTVQTEIEA